MDLQLKDHVVIVTGGAKGIGEAIVRGLAREGAIPVILDKDKAAGEALSRQLAVGSFIALDLNDAAACQQAVEETVSRHGRINGVVNNAGYNDSIGLHSGNPEKFLRSMTNNVGHFYFMVYHAMAQLKATRGSIVNIGSKTSVTGQGSTSGYVAAKGAVLALTRAWAVELLPWSVRVNAVIPAEVQTPLYDNWIASFPDPAAKLKTMTDRVPFEHRLTQPTEIADSVLFLLSARSSHTTGQWLFVDGGYTHLDRAIS